MDKYSRNGWRAFEGWKLSLSLAQWGLAVLFSGLAVTACGGGGGGSGGPSPQPPIISFNTDQDASVVIGQPDFDTGTAGTAPNKMDMPRVQMTVVGGALFIPDFDNNRVLGFNAIPTANNASADFVVGQPDLATVTAGTTASKFSGPSGVASNGSRLFVAEDLNNRVLIFNAIPAADNPSADVVLGQAHFLAAVASCGATGMFNPRSVWVAGGKLIVADSSNGRVLIWNTIPTADTEPADLVLGKLNMTTCGGSLPTASLMNSPRSVWSDGIRLVVGDSSNNRVLIWNAFPTVDGQAADVVVGQPDFTTNNTPGVSASLTNLPYASSNGTQLFVGDDDQNRVLIWNAFPTTNGAAADVVLGQADFTSISASGAAINTLSGPNGTYPIGNLLIVSDSLHNRVLIFQGQ